MAESQLPSTVRPAPSGFPLSELVVVGIFALVGGLFFGVLTYILFSAAWVIVLFPIIIGFVVGYVYAGIIHLFRVRSFRLVKLAAVLTSLLIYLTNFYLFYLEIYELVDIEEMSFWSFMQLNASEGFTIGRFGGTGIPVSGVFFWLAWLGETALTGAIVAALGLEVCEQPFCQECQKWHKKPVLLGGIALEQLADFERAIQAGEYQQANGLIQPEYNEPERIDIYLSSCNNSAHDRILRAEQQIDKRHQPRTKELWRRTISPNDALFFRQN
jgi:hypothetical protein